MRELIIEQPCFLVGRFWLPIRIGFEYGVLDPGDPADQALIHAYLAQAVRDGLLLKEEALSLFQRRQARHAVSFNPLFMLDDTPILTLENFSELVSARLETGGGNERALQRLHANAVLTQALATMEL